MALLDIQAMDSARDDTRCGGSDLSVLLCDSFLSTLCVL
jgi:hypothetical protein